MNFVIDASVAIKWFVKEDQTEKALRLLERQEPFCAPDLIIPEVTNIAWKKLTRDEIPYDQAIGIANAIQSDSLVIYPSTLINERALEIALSLNHPVYDCLYIACAEAVDGVLVTADQRLLSNTKGSNFERLVVHVGDLHISEGGIISLLRISLEKVEEIIHLSRLIQITEDNLRKELVGERWFSPINIKDFSPLFDSPNWINLYSRVRGLPEDELTDLLALGWLGQGYSGTEWPLISNRARSTLRRSDNRYLNYICSLACYLENGLGLLQGKT